MFTAAFWKSIGSKVGLYLLKLLYRYGKDHYDAWIERRRLAKKDAEAKPRYEETVRTGTNTEVIRETEDSFNNDP